MRRITLALVATAAVLVLLFSYRTSLSGSSVPAASVGAPPGVVRSAGPAAPAPSTSDSPDGSTSDGSGSGGSGSGSGSGSSSGNGNGNETVNGSLEDNGYGPVQVQISVSGKRIVDVTTVALPADGRSRRINSYAVPMLRQEVLAAQSARIDTVTGATATSEAYTRSLQAAIDAAHLGS